MSLTFEATPLPGAFLVRSTGFLDDRGGFSRMFCASVFAEKGLATNFPQANVCTNRYAGTLRGMHFQRRPFAEDKLVRCVSGAIFDVIVDVRPESPSHLRWFGAVLTAENGLQLYVPKGFAHGYQTLHPDATVLYMVSHPYTPSAEAGLRPDDPAVGIVWPLPIGMMSPKDRSWPLLDSRLPAGGGAT